MPSRSGGLGVEPKAERGRIRRRFCSPQEDSFSPGVPGAETLPVAFLACNSSPAANGCGEAKARPHSHTDAGGLRASLRPSRRAPARNRLAASNLAPGACGSCVTPRASPFLITCHNSTEHIETKAGRASLAKARAATVSPTSTPSLYPVPFARARTPCREVRVSLCLRSLLSLNCHPINPRLRRRPVFDPKVGQPRETSDCTSLLPLSKGTNLARKEGIPICKESGAEERVSRREQARSKSSLTCQSYSFLASREVSAKNPQMTYLEKRSPAVGERMGQRSRVRQLWLPCS